MSETLKLLIDLQRDQTAVTNSLWSLYQVVSFAILGYVFSQKSIGRDKWMLAILTFGFLFFAQSNQNALMRAYELIAITTQQLNAMGMANTSDANNALAPVLKTFSAPVPCLVRFGHYLFTVFVAAGIWIPYIRARRSHLP
jgi:hypothetical protein